MNYFERQLYKKSKFFQRFIDMLQSGEPRTSCMLLNALNNAIHANWQMRAYNEASYLINNYGYLAEQCEDYNLRAKFYLYSLRVFNSIGISNAAETIIKEVFRIKSKMSKDLWYRCLHQYSFTLADQEKYDKMAEVLRVVFKSPDKHLKYVALKGLLMYAFKTQKIDLMEKYLLQLKELAAAQGSELEALKIQWHEGTLLYYKGKYKESLNQLKSVAMQLERRGQPSYWIYFHIALNYEKMRDYTRVYEALQKAIDLIEEGRAALSNNEYRRYYLRDKIKIYNLMLEACALLGRKSEYFHYLQLARSRALTEVLIAESGLRSVPPKAQKQIDKLRSMIDKEYNSSHPRVEFLQALQQELHSIFIHLGEKIGKDVSVLKLIDIQSVLNPHSLYIDIFYTRKWIIRLVVTKTNVLLTALPYDELSLMKWIEEARYVLSSISEKIPPHSKWFLHKLYDMLFDGILSEQYSKIYFCVNGALRLLPVHALYDGNKFLFEKYELVELFSPYAFQRGEKRKKVFSALGIINPTGDLIYTESEGRVLKQVFKDVKILQRSEATQRAVEQEMEKYDVLHFACHGAFEKENPFFSYLLLSHASRGLKKNRFEVNEIILKDLSKVNLCVLSACESGVVEVERTDEMEGLPRAFLVAGAKNVIATYWRVYDSEYIAEFFERFYSEYLESQDVIASFYSALRQMKARKAGFNLLAGFKLITQKIDMS